MKESNNIFNFGESLFKPKGVMDTDHIFQVFQVSGYGVINYTKR